MEKWIIINDKTLFINKVCTNEVKEIKVKKTVKKDAPKPK